MRVFTRKKNEGLLIGESIVVTVIAIAGGKVRLGIESCREVPLHRREEYEAIHAPEADRLNDSAGDAPGRDS